VIELVHQMPAAALDRRGTGLEVQAPIMHEPLDGQPQQSPAKPLGIAHVHVHQPLDDGRASGHRGTRDGADGQMHGRAPRVLPRLDPGAVDQHGLAGHLVARGERRGPGGDLAPQPLRGRRIGQQRAQGPGGPPKGHLDPQPDGLLDQLVEEPPPEGKPQLGIDRPKRPAAGLAAHLQDRQQQAPPRCPQHPAPPTLADQRRAVAARAAQPAPMGRQPLQLDVPKPLPVAPGKGLVVQGRQMNKQPVDNVPGAGNNPFREG